MEESVKLVKGDIKKDFVVKHAENILNHAINKTIKPSWKLEKDSGWKLTEGILKKKNK